VLDDTFRRFDLSATKSVIFLMLVKPATWQHWRPIHVSA